MKHAPVESASELPEYECESCLHRVRAEHNPGHCPKCENEMQNISVPRE